MFLNQHVSESRNVSRRFVTRAENTWQADCPQAETAADWTCILGPFYSVFSRILQAHDASSAALRPGAQRGSGLGISLLYGLHCPASAYPTRSVTKPRSDIFLSDRFLCLYSWLWMNGRWKQDRLRHRAALLRCAVAEFCNVALMLPVDVLRGKNTEADDLIAGVVHRDGKQQKRIVSTALCDNPHSAIRS